MLSSANNTRNDIDGHSLTVVSLDSALRQIVGFSPVCYLVYLNRGYTVKTPG